MQLYLIACYNLHKIRIGEKRLTKKVSKNAKKRGINIHDLIYIGLL